MRKKITSKKTTTSQGIGRIEDATSLIDLVKELGKIVSDGFVQSSDRTPQINYIKRQIDQLVGRSRSNFTKTDVYQALFLMVLGSYQENQGEIPFTKVNTIVAKLSTEGQYGNTGVVRRQTTIEKFNELFNRILFSGTTDERRIRTFANTLYSNSLTSTRKDALWSIVGPTSVGARGRTGTRTERVSNRTRRTTTPARSTTSTTRRATTTTPTRTTSRTSESSLQRVIQTTDSNIFRLSESARETVIKSWYLMSYGGADATPKQQMGYISLLLRYYLYETIAGYTDSARVNINSLKNAFIKLYTNAQKYEREDFITLSNLGKIYDRIRVLAFVLGRYKILSAKQLTTLLRGYTKQQLMSLTRTITRENNSIPIDTMVYSAFGNEEMPYSSVINTIGVFKDLRSLRGMTTQVAKIFLNGNRQNNNIPSVLVFPPYGGSESVTIRPTQTTSTQTTSTQQVRDDNPRSTTPPESSVTPQLVREIPFTGTVGIEIEYYGVPKRILEDKLEAGGIKAKDVSYTHQVTPYWKLTTDVTSEGKHAGEMVSPILKGKAGLVEARKCINICQEAGMLVNRSGGFHVHFGMQGVSVQSIKNIIVNYNNLQPIIDKMLHRWRRGSGWGKSFTSAQIRKIQDARDMQDIFKAISGENRTFTNTYNDVRHQGRYHAINVFCYLSYGTIEFRQYTAVLESDTVLMWIYFLHFLIEASKKKQLTKFDWKNVENFLPKKVATFWANRIYELGEGTDRMVTDYSSREQR
jgi:hypothetical protein